MLSSLSRFHPQQERDNLRDAFETNQISENSRSVCVCARVCGVCVCACVCMCACVLRVCARVAE